MPDKNPDLEWLNNLAEESSESIDSDIDEILDPKNPNPLLSDKVIARLNQIKSMSADKKSQIMGEVLALNARLKGLGTHEVTQGSVILKDINGKSDRSTVLGIDRHENKWKLKVRAEGGRLHYIAIPELLADLDAPTEASSYHLEGKFEAMPIDDAPELLDDEEEEDSDDIEDIPDADDGIDELIAKIESAPIEKVVRFIEATFSADNTRKENDEIYNGIVDVLRDRLVQELSITEPLFITGKKSLADKKFFLQIREGRSGEKMSLAEFIASKQEQARLSGENALMNEYREKDLATLLVDFSAGDKDCEFIARVIAEKVDGMRLEGEVGGIVGFFKRKKTWEIHSLSDGSISMDLRQGADIDKQSPMSVVEFISFLKQRRAEGFRLIRSEKPLKNESSQDKIVRIEKNINDFINKVSDSSQIVAYLKKPSLLANVEVGIVSRGGKGRQSMQVDPEVSGLVQRKRDEYLKALNEKLKITVSSLSLSDLNRLKKDLKKSKSVYDPALQTIDAAIKAKK